MPSLTQTFALVLAVTASATALTMALMPYGGPPEELQFLFHGGAFLIIGFFFAVSLPHKPWGGLLLAFALGLTIEGVQHFVPGRSASVEDMLANCVGIASGGLLYAAVKFASARSKSAPF
ncbi:MAG: VanZ family protein [Candidatus Phaeomarinobacter sp.]